MSFFIVFKNIKLIYFVNEFKIDIIKEDVFVIVSIRITMCLMECDIFFLFDNASSNKNLLN